MPMTPARTLLVINPNTSSGVTQDLQSLLQATLGEAAQVRSVTARFGAPYIASEAAYAVATHATLDAWMADQQAHPVPDAVLIGCFGDPGLHGLRELAASRVTGLAEAALAEAAAHGPCAIVTGGERWGPMLTRICRTLPHGERVRGIVTVPMSGADMRADPQGAQTQLGAACHQVLREHPDVGSIIIGGAALGGCAARLQDRVDRLLIDSVLAGARHALRATSGEGWGAPDWLKRP